MTNNKKIVFVSILGTILAVGLLALNPSAMVGKAEAQMYDNRNGHDNSDNDYNAEPNSSFKDIQGKRICNR